MNKYNRKIHLELIQDFIRNNSNLTHSQTALKIYEDIGLKISVFIVGRISREIGIKKIGLGVTRFALAKMTGIDRRTLECLEKKGKVKTEKRGAFNVYPPDEVDRIVKDYCTQAPDGWVRIVDLAKETGHHPSSLTLAAQKGLIKAKKFMHRKKGGGWGWYVPPQECENIKNYMLDFGTIKVSYKSKAWKNRLL